MFFANLGLAELLGLFAVASAVTVTLYLLSRARQKHRVSTLRFWTNAVESVKQVHRHRIDQPWSLFLQLLGIFLLLLALAQPRLGKKDSGARDHVLLLDTTAWSAARTADGTILRDAKIQALRWLRALPSQDRVMVVKLDTLPTPATRFETNHRTVENVIRQAQSGAGALPIEDAFDFAKSAQRINAQRSGEIVYAGIARIVGTVPEQLPANLRVLAVKAAPENVGITKLDLRRPDKDPQQWQGVLSVRNYGARPRTIPYVAALGGAVVGTGSLSLAAGAENSVAFAFRSSAAGWCEVRLIAPDDLPLDDRVTVELPEQKPLRVIVYSADSASLRPIFGADPRFDVSYAAPAEYRPDPDANLMILDRMRVPSQPRRNAIWIEPPANASPIPARAASGEVKVENWLGDHPLGAGLRTRDLKVNSPLLLTPEKNDIPIGRAKAGALIVARAGNLKTVVFGFHPLRSALRFELVTPLLFANIVHWMSPGAFRRQEVQANSAGAMNIALDSSVDPASVRLLGDDGAEIPFTVEGRELRFFTAKPTTVRVVTDVSEQVYAMNLPRVAETPWTIPASVRRDLSGLGASVPLPKETWPWLAAFGLAALVADWFLFGRRKDGLFSLSGRGTEAPPSSLRRAS